MRFWDSSAILPLIIAESASNRMRELHASDRLMLVWWGTLIECHSGLARRQRAGMIPAKGGEAAGQALRELSQYWTEIEPVPAIREVAIRLVGTHDLRAADALQLAAAVEAKSEAPGPLHFVCLDQRLAAAATKEGMIVQGGDPK